MCHGYMALLMLKTRKLFNNLGVFCWYDVVSVLLCRKIGFKGKMIKKEESSPRTKCPKKKDKSLHQRRSHATTYVTWKPPTPREWLS